LEILLSRYLSYVSLLFRRIHGITSKHNIFLRTHPFLITESTNEDHIGFEHRRIFFLGYQDCTKDRPSNPSSFNYDQHYEDRRNFNPDGILRTILTCPNDLLLALKGPSITSKNYKGFLELSLIYTNASLLLLMKKRKFTLKFNSQTFLYGYSWWKTEFFTSKCFGKLQI